MRRGWETDTTTAGAAYVPLRAGVVSPIGPCDFDPSCVKAWHEVPRFEDGAVCEVGEGWYAPPGCGIRKALWVTMGILL